MRRWILVLAMVLALAGTVFANGSSTSDPNITVTATGGAGGSATIQKGAISNDNSNLNVIGVDTDIKNSQSQKQNQNNAQTISPTQTLTVMPNLPYAPNPSQGTWLSYIHGGQRDVTAGFPQFITRIQPLSSNDVIYKTLSINANNKFKNVYDVAISETNKVLAMGWPVDRIRRQVLEIDAQKSWNTSGNIAANIVSSTGPTSGAGGLGSIIPSVGGAKINELYTVVFVLVSYK